MRERLSTDAWTAPGGFCITTRTLPNRSAAGAAPLDFPSGPGTVEGSIEVESAGELRRIGTPSATTATNRPCSLVWTRSSPAAVIKKGGAGAATWVPAIYRNRDFVLTGGLMGYHASFDGYRHELRRSDLRRG